MPSSASAGGPPGPLARTGSTLFAVWRGLVSAAFAGTLAAARAARRAAVRWWSQWASVRDYHRAPEDAWADQRASEAAAALGVRAFAFGVCVATAVIATTGSGALAAIATAGIEVTWVVARFAIVALLTPAPLLPRRRLALAYGAGLLPYVLGVVAPGRLAALALSAWLTTRGLRGAGLSRRDTAIAVGWAFGGQVTVLALAWLARGALTVVALA